MLKSKIILETRCMLCCFSSALISGFLITEIGGPFVQVVLLVATYAKVSTMQLCTAVTGTENTPVCRTTSHMVYPFFLRGQNVVMDPRNVESDAGTELKFQSLQ